MKPGTGPKMPPGTRRLSVNVSCDVGEAIEELAKGNNTTITDVIRRAVSIYKFVDDVVHVHDGKILVEQGGSVREVQFLL